MAAAAAAPAARTKNLPRGGKSVRFVVGPAPDGSFGWSLVAPVGRVVASAAGFASREAAHAAVADFRLKVAAARILDEGE